MNKEAFEKVLRLSEEFFGTAEDPEQMPVNQDSADKLYSIHPDTILYKFDEQNNPIAWVVAVPTSIETMNKFLTKQLSERELLEVATKEKSFESIYLCGVFVLPEYRKKGFASALSKEVIRKLSYGKNLPLYSWAYSEEGKSLIGFLMKDLGVQIALRQN